MAIPTFIIGTGGLGRGVAEVTKILENKDRNWKIEGFIDDNKPRGEIIEGLEVCGSTEDLIDRTTITNVIIAVGHPSKKKLIYHRLKKNSNLLFPNVIHPSITLNPSINIGMGNIITENVSFSSQIVVANFCLIHFNSTIGHDVILEDFVSIYPSATISGFTELRKGSQVGTNAAILANVIIEHDATVGAGAMVNKDVKPASTVIGIPAKAIRTRGSKK